jgi:hypothetical protein
MLGSRLLIGFLAAGALASAAAASRIGNEANPGRVSTPARARPLQSGECSERQGPFATQDAAWANVHQAEGQGFGVSGVFPCYDGAGYRGYCFNVFYPC